uniref:Secreted protein n=1 Tax=Anguilla anguilla TaxID=7936 RepID=A0A0E9RUF5_ANGAN
MDRCRVTVYFQRTPLLALLLVSPCAAAHFTIMCCFFVSAWCLQKPPNLNVFLTLVSPHPHPQQHSSSFQ